jgi:N utilization substance protein B
MSGDATHEQEFLFIQQVNGAYTRRQVRSLVFHLLYAMEEFEYDVSLESLIDNFNRGFDQQIDAGGEVAQMAQEIVNQRKALDLEITPFLEHWRMERLGVCTKLILRIGLLEMNRGETDPTIVINEAVELAKCFSEKDAHKFINGVLDRIAQHKGLVIKVEESTDEEADLDAMCSVDDE